MCNIQDYRVLNITMFIRLYVRVSILVTCEKQLDYVLAHKISLTPILLLKCLYQARNVSDQVFACWGYRVSPLLRFSFCSDSDVFFVKCKWISFKYIFFKFSWGIVSVEKWNDWIDEISKMNENLNYPEDWKWR